ncbi:uncharacterized protein [Clytia hemisphaerica]|uniref:Cation-dependent mannose-6-phosphate receptor n=1 Tax=Clytia hemisphaerica TaxID=252671 RepID=A0A7M5WQC4_9CNID|eukprot:TCONS_00027920-protein
MKHLKVKWQVLLYIAFIYIKLSDSKVCIASGPCGCKLDDDSAEMDLSPLMNNAPSPMFSGVDTSTGGFSVSVDLCRTFACLNTNDAMFCAIDAIPSPFVIGNKLSSFDYDEENDIVTFIYTLTGAAEPATIRIVLHCTQDSGIGKMSDFDISGQGSTFKSTLLSKYACWKRSGGGGGSGAKSGGLSKGSILCISLLVISVVYIVGGILINKYVRKVDESTSLCPNAEFWKVLPGYIKDGFMFTKSKIKKDKEYEQI